MSFFSNPAAFFMHPATMLAGVLLALLPIVIHFINRMRFRRVRWAAMEFLLKAQKRQRRKKILEQLLLLLLRVLLVLLAGLLFARFLGFDPLAGKETRPTLHVIVLDDTPSMSDRGDDGKPGGTFQEAKRQITEQILPAAAQAGTDQWVRVVRLSELADLANPDPAKDPEKLNSDLIDRLRQKLGGEGLAPVRTGLADGLKKAKEWLDKAGPDAAKVVHVVSDMRATDWTQDAEAIGQAVKAITDGAGAKVHLIDVAAPYRKVDRKVPDFSDNVGIVELKPRTRVVAATQAVEFEVRVKNYGTTDVKDVQVWFYLNGQGNQQTVNFDLIPANQERAQLTSIIFNQVGTAADPLAAFNLVTAKLPGGAGGAIAADDVRHAVVEVRDKLKVLVIEGRPELRDDRKGDGFYLRRLFQDAFGGVEWVPADGPEALLREDLRQFSTIFLLNVQQLAKPQVERLEQYVREGGGVGVFLGPKVSPGPYNELMYKNGDGFFPVPLPDPLPQFEPLTEEQKLKRILSLSKRVLMPDPAVKTHPALAGLYTDARGIPVKDSEIERFFFFAYIDHHVPVSRLGAWRKETETTELYCLANERPMKEFENDVVQMIAAAHAKYGEPKFEKYREDQLVVPQNLPPPAPGTKPRFEDFRVPGVKSRLEDIRKVVSSDDPVTELARKMDALLADEATSGDPNEALLREFWGQPEMAEARDRARALRDSCKYGDPLYVARRFGNGRVVAMTTTVGAPWSEWPTGGGAAGWVPVMREMQKYLAGGGAEMNRSVGTTYADRFEAGRYKPSAEWVFLSADTSKNDKGSAPLIREPKPGTKPNTVNLGTATPAGGQPALTLDFADTKRVGAYLFTLTWQKKQGDPPTAPAEKPEYVAVVFNTDTAREGDLRRASTDDLVAVAGAGFGDKVEKPVALHSADDTSWTDRLTQKPTDLSSGRWVYLVILLVLIAEQALAVRLSYHTRPEDLTALAPSAAAAFDRTATVGLPGPDGEPAPPEPAGTAG